MMLLKKIHEHYGNASDLVVFRVPYKGRWAHFNVKLHFCTLEHSCIDAFIDLFWSVGFIGLKVQVCNNYLRTLGSAKFKLDT